jgi:uncharacterized membrane protein YbhN (UPF0104 family)
LLYLSAYTNRLSIPLAALLFVVLLLANLLFNSCNKKLADMAVACAARFTKTEITPIEITPARLTLIQLIITGSWVLTGLSSYFLARGAGLPLSLAETIPVTAAFSLSWVAGYAAVFSPGGLGVREGVMLLLLKPVLAVQTALLLPVLSRALVLLSELILGVASCFLFRQNGFFSGGGRADEE